MSRGPAAVVLVLGLLAAQLRSQLEVADIAARMQSAVGEAAGPAAGDLELTGHVEIGGHAFAQRILVRREPFAYREELTWIAPTPGKSPPPGTPRQTVYLSDGEHCWNLADEAGPAGALTGWPAVAVLDNALLFRLLLDPRQTLERVVRRPPRVVTDDVARPGVDEEVIFLAWAHGTGWLARIERESGRLTALFDSTGTTQRWYQIKDWRSLAEGLTFPELIEAGAERRVGPVQHIDSLRCGLSHDDSDFPGDPAPRLGAVEDVARLRVLHFPVPGTALVVLPEGHVHGGSGGAGDVWTLFDTGTGGIFVDPRLAQQLGLLRVGLQSITGAAGGGVSDWLWLDRMAIGGHAWLQMPAGNPPLPGFHALPPGRSIGLVFGGSRLMACSPILDLRAGRLLLRGRGPDGNVRSLAEIAGRPALSIPLRTDGQGTLMLDFSLGGVSSTAMLDTGLLQVLRLSRADMRRLGLQEDDAWWLQRGALTIASGGIHGHEQEELLVRLEQDLQLGPVTLRQPYALLMSREMEGADRAVDATLIGMGALSAFEQVGFDGERALELVAPPELLQSGETLRAVVPPVGEHLGFDLQPPVLGARARPHDLPHVVRVIDDLPAARAGLRDGDFLAEVDGVPCAGVAPMDLWAWLRVREGRALTLKVLRGEETVVVTFGG